MEPIFETTLISQNRNGFNKIISLLNSSKVERPRSRNKKFAYVLNDELCYTKLQVDTTLEFDGIILNETADRVYFLAKCSYDIQDIYVGYNNSNNALENILIGIQEILLGNYYLSNTSELRKKFEAEGIDDNVLKTKSKEEIKDMIFHTKFYSKISETVNYIESTKLNTVMVPKAVARLKMRNNVVPLMWLDKDTSIIDFAYTRKAYGSGVNTAKYRSKESLRRMLNDPISMKNICKSTKEFTPYNEWLTWDTSKLSNVPYVDVNKTELYNSY